MCRPPVACSMLPDVTAGRDGLCGVVFAAGLVNAGFVGGGDGTATMGGCRIFVHIESWIAVVVCG